MPASHPVPGPGMRPQQPPARAPFVGNRLRSPDFLRSFPKVWSDNPELWERRTEPLALRPLEPPAFSRLVVLDPLRAVPKVFAPIDRVLQERVEGGVARRGSLSRLLVKSRKILLRDLHTVSPSEPERRPRVRAAAAVPARLPRLGPGGIDAAPKSASALSLLVRRDRPRGAGSRCN